MQMLMEYFYCIIYVCSLVFCIYKYLDRKPMILYLVTILFIYGLVDFLITGDYVIHIETYLITNILVLISDYIMICILNKRLNMNLLFYTSLYAILFMVYVNVIMYCLETFQVMSILESYYPSIQRLFLIIIFNGLSILTFILLKKSSFIPKIETINKSGFLFNLANVIFYLVLLVFFATRMDKIDNMYSLFFIITFIILWLILINTINYTIQLSIENEKSIISDAIFKSIEEYVYQQKEEEDRIRKIKHDIKNHLIILKNISMEKRVQEYLEGIYTDLNQLKQKKQDITGNVYLDAIINAKEQQFPNVKFSYFIKIGSLNIDSKDLSSLVFNLLDNAAKATGEIRGEVFIKMVQDDRNLYIQIVNDCVSKPSFVSNDRNHGYGLSIINDIVKKYHGDIEFQYLNKKVECKIFLFM